MASASDGATKRRILIVEDDPDVRRTLERCLAREGCEVTAAVDGKEAAEKIDRARPELVFTDLEMPRAGGREVVALAVQRRVPVVVLTGHGTVQTAVELMRAGAANFLTKPFTPDTLITWRTRQASNQPQRRLRPVLTPNSWPRRPSCSPTSSVSSVGNGPEPTRVV